MFRGKLIRYSMTRDGMLARLTRALGSLQPELKILGSNSYQERENGAKSQNIDRLKALIAKLPPIQYMIN